MNDPHESAHPTAAGPRTTLEDLLAREGEWEVRVTVYRNGRRVGTCDTTGHPTFESAAYWATEGLQTGEIEPHVPRRRRTTARSPR